jgi:hypothetical protein
MTSEKTKNWIERCTKENAERIDIESFVIECQRMTHNGTVNG